MTATWSALAGVSCAVMAKPPWERMSASSFASEAPSADAGSRYTPSLSTPQPLSFRERHRRMRSVELRVGRLSTRAVKLSMAVISITRK
jgi:hypothetical protein